MKRVRDGGNRRIPYITLCVYSCISFNAYGFIIPNIHQKFPGPSLRPLKVLQQQRTYIQLAASNDYNYLDTDEDINSLYGETSSISDISSSSGDDIIEDSSSDDREEQQHRKAKYTLITGSSSLPHPERAETGGEDAFFVRRYDLGVFDGVAGWRAMGYDVGNYTRTFALACAQNITQQRKLWDEYGAERSNKIATFKGVDLRQALQHGLDTANSVGVGSCTACLASFDPESGLVTGVNLGDSGLLLLRRDLAQRLFVAYKSAPQQHRFNFPYQLGTNSTDTPSSAASFLFYARPGDIIILATDGLLDNMFDEDIVARVSSLSTKRMGRAPERIAAGLLIAAFNLSINKSRESPWQLAAKGARRKFGDFRRSLGEAARGGRDNIRREEDTAYIGGKMDDITCIVARVEEIGNEI